MLKIKINKKLETIVIFPVVFCNGSTHGYHFIIKELANKLEGQFKCLEENTKTYKCSIPIEKEVTDIEKDGNESVFIISYKIKFIDSARLMATLLSNLVDNLTEEIQKIKCNDYDCFLEYESVKDNLIKCKCLSYSKNYLNKLDEIGFKNTFKFSNNDINKFILLLRKVVYPYEYMDDWEKFNETSLPEKEEFYNKLDMEDITDADYMHAKSL